LSITVAWAPPSPKFAPPWPLWTSTRVTIASPVSLFAPTCSWWAAEPSRAFCLHSTGLVSPVWHHRATASAMADVKLVTRYNCSS
jgi:hypothetical protein